MFFKELFQPHTVSHTQIRYLPKGLYVYTVLCIICMYSVLYAFVREREMYIFKTPESVLGVQIFEYEAEVSTFPEA